MNQLFKIFKVGEAEATRITASPDETGCLVKVVEKKIFYGICQDIELPPSNYYQIIAKVKVLIRDSPHNYLYMS